MNLLDIFETAYSAFTRINLAHVHTKLTSESSHRNQTVLKPRLQSGFKEGPVHTNPGKKKICGFK